jgi:hypothetical protein
MSILAIVPDWNATPELAERAEGRKGYEGYIGSFRGFDLQFSKAFNCDVIIIDPRPESLPKALADLPIVALVVIKPNSPVTTVPDNKYVDGNITARVETTLITSDGKGAPAFGLRVQDLRATGTNGVTVEELNSWFDRLLAGEHNDKATTSGVTYQSAQRDRQHPTTAEGDILLVDTSNTPKG